MPSYPLGRERAGHEATDILLVQGGLEREEGGYRSYEMKLLIIKATVLVPLGGRSECVCFVRERKSTHH